MRNKDIRTSKEAATIEHQSSRGKIIRNSSNFTRGSQLFSHEVLMTWAGIKVPLLFWIAAFAIFMIAISSFYLKEHQVQLVLMRTLSVMWEWVSLDPNKPVNLTLPDQSIVHGKMGWVTQHPAVIEAWQSIKKIFLASGIGAAFICVPFTIWFVDYSHRRGADILKERHDRGALLVEQPILHAAISAHNDAEHKKECSDREPPVSPKKVLQLPVRKRVDKGFHAPYYMATVPMPWRLEQSHAMFIGTTGTGKTTELKKIVLQARQRGHRCVIFDLTGSFIESFYNPDTDKILNTMDQRCEPWCIFNDCHSYAEFLSAATALIPSGHNAEDDFWQKAARTVFVEMCQKLIAKGDMSNGALAHHLMQAKLADISKELENTVAAPLVATQAAKMAESIRATFNTNANALRFLPDPEQGKQGFSIKQWMREDKGKGSILFISSTHSDLVLNKSLLTLWMDLSVNALFALERTRNLRTWFLIDEVHALSRLPAIEHGLQTARAVGGAFILGMHSFDALAETYGEKGAVNLASLARTKLILGTADIETAKKCADFIGSREVRQMDEAYSYGYNNTRDASTITPRKNVEHLVMADDLTNLRSLEGYIKFPDGFPAARVQLKWRHYDKMADGFMRVEKMRAAKYNAPADEEEPKGEDGREGDGPANKPEKILALDDEKQPEHDLQSEMIFEKEREEKPAQKIMAQENIATIAKSNEQTKGDPSKTADKGRTALGDSLKIDHRKLATKDKDRLQDKVNIPSQKVTENDNKAKDEIKRNEDSQESQILREERMGIGIGEPDQDEPELGFDDGMEM